MGDRVSRLAAGLKSTGIEEGDRVAVLSLNSDRYLEAYLAVAWAGAVIVPLNIRWSRGELEHALSDCRPGILMVDGTFAAIGADLAKSLTGLKLLYADEGAAPDGMASYEALIGQNASIPDAMRTSSDLAAIFYTGGTTGRSKGVMLTHGNIMASAMSTLGDGLFSGDVRYLHTAPMFHIANGVAMFSLFLRGGVNIIIPSFVPETVMETIESEGVTHTIFIPTMIQMLVDHPDFGSYDLSSLSDIVYGASPVSEALLDRASHKFPEVRFTQCYGMTELSPLATILQWIDHTGRAREKGRHRSAGQATLCAEVRVVDESGKDVPNGTVGEVVVYGDNVMMGYWEMPDATENAVVDGWMHTGDCGYMDDDGFVFLVDRMKDMIISGGENVYSVEVENALSKHPAVAQCAVIGIPHDCLGETVHAEVIRKEGTTVTPDELIGFCKSLIAGYKCPRSIVIRNAPMPLSGAGKVLKSELRKPYWG